MKRFPKILIAFSFSFLCCLSAANAAQARGTPHKMMQGIRLSDYCITCAGTPLNGAASALQKAIVKKTGDALPIRTPSAGERRILLEDTGLERPMAYTITSDKSGVLVDVGGLYSAFHIGGRLCRYFKKGIVPSYLNQKGSFFHKEHIPLSPDADVRVMSSNLLVHTPSWGGKPVLPRLEPWTATLFDNHPDVVGLQELCTEWNRYLPDAVSQKYDTVLFSSPEGGVNYSPLLYNKDTLSLIDSGFHRYAYSDNTKCRVITYGVFRHKKTGKEFVVTSTHWDFGGTDKRGLYRDAECCELTDTVKSLSSRYSCPVISCGDYNSDQNSDEYRSYLDMSNSVDAQYSSGVSPLCVGANTDPYASSLCHIFLYGAAHSVGFGTLYGNALSSCSDHYPIFADIALS